MTVSGVRHLVDRAYRESGELQYLRELVINAIEASASRIEIGPEWSEVERSGVYRLMIADNGKGMGAEELLKFLNTFGGGGKPIGDAHENFGVGAKTSLLPWNHAGVVVMSWTEAEPDGAMVWLMRDPATGEYGAKKFETNDGYDEVVAPFAEWTSVKPSWIDRHGTVVVCLGNTGSESTFLGKSGDGEVKAISAYLNKRLWTTPAETKIYVQELRSGRKRDEWPRNLAEASGPAGTPDRRWNRRKIEGAAYFIEHAERQAGDGHFKTKGTVVLSDQTEIEWYLWEGERPAVHMHAHKSGYIAAVYKGELFDTQQHPMQFRSFGITQSAVRANLTIIARPPHTDGTYGVYPDTARNALKIQGTKRAGEALPWADWAQEFADKLPAAIREALAKAAPPSSGTIKDASWRTRLTDRFGARWKSLRFFSVPDGDSKIDPSDAEASRKSSGTRHRSVSSRKGSTSRRPGTPSSDAPTTSPTSSQTGAVAARQAKTKGGMPEWSWTTMSELDDKTAYAAVWNPPSAAHPDGMVQLARDFPAFVEVKAYWRDQYADHHGDRIDGVVEEVYGEVMVARLAHSESLAKNPSWGRSKIDNELRSPAALTMAVLGLLSEDQIIGSRLVGLLGKRRPEASSEAISGV